MLAAYVATLLLALTACSLAPALEIGFATDTVPGGIACAFTAGEVDCAGLDGDAGGAGLLVATEAVFPAAGLRGAFAAPAGFRFAGFKFDTGEAASPAEFAIVAFPVPASPVAKGRLWGEFPDTFCTAAANCSANPPAAAAPPAACAEADGTGAIGRVFGTISRIAFKWRSPDLFQVATSTAHR